MARLRKDENTEELKSILDRLAHVYSSCWTYEDKAVFKESTPDKSGKECVTDASFTTTFDREARRLRYEFKAKNPQTTGDRDCIVWRNGGSVKLWTRLKAKIQTVEKIGTAIASVIGYSGEPAFLIPNLLARTEIKGRGLLDMDDMFLAEKLDFSGTGFFKVTGYFPSRSMLSFWVDIKTSLILKIEVEPALTGLFGPRSSSVAMASGALVTKTAITYSPYVNTPIPESKFEMKIPEE